MKKRSVVLQGHATSVSLEDEYWAELKRMAVARGVSVNALVEAVDRDRQGPSLSSALRIAVLFDLRSAAAAEVKAR